MAYENRQLRGLFRLKLHEAGENYITRSSVIFIHNPRVKEEAKSIRSSVWRAWR
jgi:hypothetical protein